MCNCLFEKAKELKETFGYESVMPQVEIFSGRAYMDFTVKEVGKKKEQKVPLLLSKCPFCGKPYKEETE